MSIMRRAMIAMLAAVIAGCSTGTEEPDFDNPLNPGSGADIAVPETVRAQIGDNVILITWDMPAGAGVDSFAVYREETTIGAQTPLRVVATTTARTYRDTQARNGRSYAYRIAGIDNGETGPRSDRVDAASMLISMIIANDAPVTTDRDVTVSFGSAPFFEGVQISEDTTFAGANWRPFSSSVSWTLSSGEGEKRVYGKIRLSDGTETIPVTDTILLEGDSLIVVVGFEGDATRTSGESVHFWLRAEPGGRATIEVDGLFPARELGDGGTFGDPTAGDGSYEGDIVMPEGGWVLDGTVTGRFTSRDGEEAVAAGPRPLTVQVPATPVSLLEPILSVPPEPVGVQLRWTGSLDPFFESYVVHRGAGSEVGPNDPVVTTILEPATLFFLDETVVEGESYAYRVVATSRNGGQVVSNAVMVTIPNARPPVAVTLEAVGALSADRVAVDWSPCRDADFEVYHVRRNPSGPVGDTDPVVVAIDEWGLTSFEDAGLQENTEYHYRVDAMDRGGLVSRSNDKTARTWNVAPSPVTLEPPRASAGTANLGYSVALSWAPSDAHDFSSYRLYRSQNPTVDAGSTLAAEVRARNTTTFRDSGISRRKTYYYRLYVVDDGTYPGPLAVGSNIVSVEGEDEDSN